MMSEPRITTTSANQSTLVISVNLRSTTRAYVYWLQASRPDPSLGVCVLVEPRPARLQSREPVLQQPYRRVCRRRVRQIALSIKRRLR
jgi:hypothetical protein